MSRRPPHENETQARDARLDPYQRAAILTSRGDRDATLFLRMETYWTHASGHPQLGYVRKARPADSGGTMRSKFRRRAGPRR